MLYAEMNYRQKREFEATLTPYQRQKMRKLEKEFQAQALPIQQAKYAREEIVRKESWVSLKCGERINELEAENAPRFAELREQIEALRNELTDLQEKVYETRSNIQTEVYTASYNDPEAKALEAILSRTREAQREKFQKLVDTFAKVDA